MMCQHNKCQCTADTRIWSFSHLLRQTTNVPVGQGSVSLHLASSPDEFSWCRIFVEVIILPVLWQTLREKLDDGSVSSSNFGHKLHCRSVIIAQHPWIYNLMKTHLGSSPSVTKHFPEPFRKMLVKGDNLNVISCEPAFGNCQLSLVYRSLNCISEYAVIPNHVLTNGINARFTSYYSVPME